ncbi:M20/M25/M40 family metallo-hydrolase [Vulcanisaeta thermophila]|uniref:M20/M25/M40 family metallo-hydrolase n=1 Tax=Vulcanisaeta thermophila TaxID=867917 RepID=UPI0008531EEA|nr:M20/M25/M40 family metallo-hydrolase [Vulcanisaeta thermophila]
MMFTDDFKIKMLMEALSIYSPTGNEHEFAKFLYEFMNSQGVDVKIDDVGNVIATRGLGKPTLWLHAHMDTVPGMLEVRRVGDKVIGRGASDDKGPLMAMVFALLETRVVKGTVVFTGVVHEEGDSLGTKFLINSAVAPRPDGIIVAEPTGVNKVVTKYRGGVKAVIRVSTRGGHASNPDLDSNAIIKAWEIYRELSTALRSGTSYENFLVTPTMMQCGEAENVIPSRCQLTLDIRIPPGRTCSDVAKAVNDVLSNHRDGVSIELRPCTEPVEVDINNPAVRAVSRAIIKTLNQRPILARKWGTSDMNELVALTRNLVAYGPGEGFFSHSEEEFVRVDDYLNAIKIYRNSILEFMNIVQP